MSCHKEGAVSSLSHLYILVTLYVVSFPGSLQPVGSWVGPGNEAKQYQVYHILVTLYDGISGKIILEILRRFTLTRFISLKFQYILYTQIQITMCAVAISDALL